MKLQNIEEIDLDSEIGQNSGTDAEDTLKLRIVATMALIEKLQKNRFEMELGKVGLTPAQVQVLLYILRHSEKEREITAKELERRFHVSNPTMSGILKRLEKKGMIERQPGSGDRRNKRILLKGDVEKQRRMIEERVTREKELVFRDFTEEELKGLLWLMTKLLHNLKRDGNEE